MSQTSRIATHLLLGKSITPLEALKRFGCFRLAARVRDLKRQGLQIQTQIKRRGGKSFASYQLV